MHAVNYVKIGIWKVSSQINIIRQMLIAINYTMKQINSKAINTQSS